MTEEEYNEFEELRDVADKFMSYYECAAETLKDAARAFEDYGFNSLTTGEMQSNPDELNFANKLIPVLNAMLKETQERYKLWEERHDDAARALDSDAAMELMDSLNGYDLGYPPTYGVSCGYFGSSDDFDYISQGIGI